MRRGENKHALLEARQEDFMGIAQARDGQALSWAIGIRQLAALMPGASDRDRPLAELAYDLACKL